MNYIAMQSVAADYATGAGHSSGGLRSYLVAMTFVILLGVLIWCVIGLVRAVLSEGLEWNEALLQLFLGPGVFYAVFLVVLWQAR